MPSFEEFLAGQTVHVSVWDLVINLILAAILGIILTLTYIRYGSSLSNRRLFARDFVILVMTTALIITIVKSSLALSLGLVGALSIVRFRAAIKEPEELMYLFLGIAVGLGLGAGQRLATIVAFFLIIIVIVLRRRLTHKQIENRNLHLIVSSEEPGRISLQQITDILNRFCSYASIRRFDETEAMLEASFVVELTAYQQLESIRGELSQLSKSVKVTFMDSEGVY